MTSTPTTHLKTCWANIMSAEVNGGEELFFVKEYLPNSYEALKKILKGAK